MSWPQKIKTDTSKTLTHSLGLWQQTNETRPRHGYFIPYEPIPHASHLGAKADNTDVQAIKVWQAQEYVRNLERPILDCAATLDARVQGRAQRHLAAVKQGIAMSLGTHRGQAPLVKKAMDRAGYQADNPPVKVIDHTILVEKITRIPSKEKRGFLHEVKHLAGSQQDELHTHSKAQLRRLEDRRDTLQSRANQASGVHTLLRQHIHRAHLELLEKERYRDSLQDSEHTQNVKQKLQEAEEKVDQLRQAININPSYEICAALSQAEQEVKNRALQVQAAQQEQAQNGQIHPGLKAAQAAVNENKARLQALQEHTQRARSALERTTPQAEQAALQADDARDQIAHHQRNVLLHLAHTPEGFSPSSLQSPDGLNLQKNLRELALRLQTPPQSKTQAQFEKSYRMPSEQAMRIFLQALDMVAQGNASLAQTLTQAVVEHRFNDWVPAPGQPAPNTMLSHLISLIANNPNGLDILEHLAPPSQEAASEISKNAVLVYYRIHQLKQTNPPIDEANQAWLQDARMGAQQLAHPQAHHSQTEQQKALPTAQRVAFNGVRTGLTSVGPGSLHDQANTWLLRILDMFSQAPQPGCTLKHNPADARRIASTVAADVGLPGSENLLNQDLRQACGLLLQLLQREKQALPQDAPTPEGLVRAQAFVQTLMAQYDKNKRLSELKLDRRFWCKVNKKIAQEAQTTRAAPPCETNTPHESHFDPADLSAALHTIENEHLTALQALQTLRHQYQADIHSGSSTNSPGRTQTSLSERTPSSFSSSDSDPLADPDTHHHPRTVTLKRSLENAQTHQDTLDKFLKDGSFESFIRWALPAISPVFGTIVMSKGHVGGVSLGSLVNLITQISGLVGIAVQPTIDLTGSQRTQLSIGRDARGLMLMAFDEIGHNENLGFGAGLALNIPKMPLRASLIPSLTHGYNRLHSQGGLVLRSPRAGEIPHAQAIREFGEMMETLGRWNQLDTPYNSPLQALLDLYPRVSIGGFEQLTTSTHTAATGVSASLRAKIPTGTVTHTVGVTGGLGTRREAETKRFTHAGSTQPYASDAKTITHAAGVMGSIGYGVIANVGPHQLRPGHASTAGGQSINSSPASMSLNMGVHIASAKSGVNVIGWPDGSMMAERTLSFNNFKEFIAQVEPQRQAWIQCAMRKFDFPTTYAEQDKHIECERAFNDFLEKSKHNLDAGTHTLVQYLELKPQVCAQLGGYKALQLKAQKRLAYWKENPQALAQARARERAIAQEKGTNYKYIDPLMRYHADALAYEAEQERLLLETSSYRPFLLLSQLRSTITQSKGLNFLAVAQKDTSAKAWMTCDRYPHMETPGQPGYSGPAKQDKIFDPPIMPTPHAA